MLEGVHTLSEGVVLEMTRGRVAGRREMSGFEVVHGGHAVLGEGEVADNKGHGSNAEMHGDKVIGSQEVDGIATL